MSRIALIAKAVVLVALVQPAIAADEASTWDRIENIHGDAAGFFELIDALQDAVTIGDAAAIAEYGLYPLAVNDSDGNYEIIDASDFVDSFDIAFTAETQQAVLDQDPDDLIVTSEGVGLGNGALWITNVCLDDACTQTQWGILSINN
jgi:hypothetical protein